MPSDHRHDDSDDEKELGVQGNDKRYADFDCPTCNANNPVEDGLGQGEEVLCNYCGTEFRVMVSDSGKLRLREI
ncbi:MAG: hypothetical protein ACKVPX_01980 [Myxococcaceae bacterium]